MDASNQCENPPVHATESSNVVLEHLVMSMDDDRRLMLATAVTRLLASQDPVALADSMFPGSFSHSTSWRWTPDGVILTFVHVYPDAAAPVPPAGSPVRAFTALGLEQDSVACHAVRHLHFLVKTDEDIAAIEGYQRFWDFAAEVADHHHPAVAGLLPDAPEYQI
jgi:hypothetical protein